MCVCSVLGWSPAPLHIGILAFTGQVHLAYTQGEIGFLLVLRAAIAREQSEVEAVSAGWQVSVIW